MAPDKSQEILHTEKISETERVKGENGDGFTEKDARRIRRKIDIRLLPALGLMYGISLMDRKNVSNASIAGMTKDLNLNIGYRYSLINLCFFITYIVFQAPATVVCRTLGPRNFLPGICILWGIIVIGFGFGNNWTTMLALRLILGILEAGYFTGCVYLLSTWYTRYEVAKRYSVFFLIGSFSGALSGILAYGLMQLEGVQGIRGWRWIFILEGVITCAVGIFAYISIVRFPDQELKKPSFAFLKPEQVRYVVDRLDNDRGDVEAEPFNWRRFLKPARDIEIWCFAVIFCCLSSVIYSFAFFLPIILHNNLGFSVAASQCLVAPPYVFSAILIYVSSWISDRYKTRAPIIICNSVLMIIGLTVTGWAKSPGVRYFGVFIGVAGTNAGIPVNLAYQANNIRGQWERAFCSATLTGMGGVGGIAGSLVFRSQDAPRYIPGFIASIVAACLVVILCLFLTALFHHRNKLADEGKLVINNSPEFRYTL